MDNSQASQILNLKLENPLELKFKKIWIDLSETKYPIFRKVIKDLTWHILDDQQNEVDSQKKSIPFDIKWIDSGFEIEKLVRNLMSFQKINHFPGMVNIYRKDLLARSIENMRKKAPHEYQFTPRSWIIPQDLEQLCIYMKAHPNKFVIFKPSRGAQGRGIFLSNDITQIRSLNESFIAQEYISNPLLLDGYKFDLRIYVLITCCDPLRIYLFQDGLCRICTSPYSAPNSMNSLNSFMHLTNYSINKHNTCFKPNNSSHNTENVPNNSETFHKRSISWFQTYCEKNELDFTTTWKKIADIVVKTIISNKAHLLKGFHDSKFLGLNQNPFTCFEILGLDILLTNDLQPYLLEVNHMPSFNMDSDLDRSIKSELLVNTFKLVNVSYKQRKQYYDNLSKESRQRLYKSPTSFSSSLSPHTRPSDLLIAKIHDKTEKKIAIECKYWKDYLINEKKKIGNFDLIFPADYTPGQLTEDKASIYNKLLHDSGFPCYAVRYYDIHNILSGDDDHLKALMLRQSISDDGQDSEIEELSPMNCVKEQPKKLKKSLSNISSKEKKQITKKNYSIPVKKSPRNNNQENSTQEASHLSKVKDTSIKLGIIKEKKPMKRTINKNISQVSQSKSSNQKKTTLKSPTTKEIFIPAITQDCYDCYDEASQAYAEEADDPILMQDISLDQIISNSSSTRYTESLDYEEYSQDVDSEEDNSFNHSYFLSSSATSPSASIDMNSSKIEYQVRNHRELSKEIEKSCNLQDIEVKMTNNIPLDSSHFNRSSKEQISFHSQSLDISMQELYLKYKKMYLQQYKTSIV